ncbi:MAG: flagellar hook-length control protein FliK [Proteobacteria bacterium]|nr:flagellar hook-length control protein FliK [Pseudomonadota bacterium]MBU1686806.1 flagellar hook-length control protein FliK [Pseudomonadota bacterium]
MMTPIVASFGPTQATLELGGTMAGNKSDSSFLGHFEAQLAKDQARNLFGVPSGQGSLTSPGLQADKPTISPSIFVSDQSVAERQSLVSLLVHFLNTIKDTAAETGSAAGEWQIPVVDESSLKQLLDAAGFSDVARQEIHRVVEADGQLELTSLLNTLIFHLEGLSQTNKIMIPETELPLLESFLAKMGMPPGQIQELADQAVNGDFEINLQIYAKALGNIEVTEITNPEISVSAWDIEQFQAMLGRAGVPEESMPLLFEDLLGEQPQFHFEQLSRILSNAVVKAEDTLVRVDLPSFFSGLKELLSQAGFVEKDLGWSPVVQESIERIFKELVDTVGPDFRKVTIEKGDGLPLFLKPKVPQKLMDLHGEKMDLDETIEPVISALDSSEVTPVFGETVREKIDGIVSSAIKKNARSVLTESAPKEQTLQFVLPQVDQAVTVVTETVKNAELPRTLTDLQQQAINQVGRGVIHALERKDHHLVIRLNPPELGEVKIDLLVKDDHVAVSFSMENHRVKEALEAGMGQFRENLAQKGFSLGECMVSFGNHDQQGESWRRFESAWQQRIHEGSPELMASFDGEGIYQKNIAVMNRNDGVNLIV